MAQGNQSELEYLTARKLEIENEIEIKSCESCLYLFVIKCFQILEPGRIFHPNFHLNLICEYLELIDSGKIRFLIINMPPRHMKSLICTVIWPIWTWIKNPSIRIIFSSYAGELSIIQAQKRRKILDSEFILKNWPHIRPAKDNDDRKQLTENKSLGFFKSTSTDAMVGGTGSDRIVVDDSSDPAKAESRSELKRSNDFLDYLIGTRLNDSKTGSIIVIQQRIRHDDGTALVLKKWKELKLDFHHLCLTAIAEKNEEIVFPKTGHKIFRKEGEPLWPNRFGLKELEMMKISLGPYGWAAQGQQRPTPIGGGRVKREWWRRFSQLPNSLVFGWFLDTANKDGELNDFTAAVLMGQGQNSFYVVDVIRKKLEAVTLEDFVIDIYAKFKTKIVSIEDKQSGTRLIQFFQNQMKIPVQAYKPQGDKVYRLSLCEGFISAGKVFIPESAPWISDFLDEFDKFPKGEHDDQVDAFTQAIISWTFRENVGNYEGLGNMTTSAPVSKALSGKYC